MDADAGEPRHAPCDVVGSAISLSTTCLSLGPAPDWTLTTYRVGGGGAVRHVESMLDLAACRRRGRRPGLPLLVVGRGSNLLVADRGFDRPRRSASASRLRRRRSSTAPRRSPPVAAVACRWWRPSQRRGAHRLRVGGGRARLDRRCGADERRRPRVRHGGRRSSRVRVVDLRRRWHGDARCRRRARPRLPSLRRSRRAGGGAGHAAARRRRAGDGRGESASPRSSAGGASTSPVAPTPARCSPTRPVIRPAGSSRPPGARACASARPRSPPSTPTSSRPTTTAGPTTCWR